MINLTDVRNALNERGAMYVESAIGFYIGDWRIYPKGDMFVMRPIHTGVKGAIWCTARTKRQLAEMLNECPAIQKGSEQ